MGRKSQYPGVEVRENAIRIAFQHNGKRCRETLTGLPPTPANLKHAYRLRRDIQEQIKAGVFDYAATFPDSARAGVRLSPTFGDLADRWLAGRSDLATSTRKGYRKLLDAVFVPTFGDTEVKRITYSQLAEFFGALPWSSGKTRNNALTVLRGVMEVAVVDGLIGTNPAARLKFAKHQSVLPDPLTLDEVDAVLNWMQTHLPAGVHNYFEVAFFSGLRTSELIALRWEDVDLNGDTIMVRRAKVMKEQKGTKTYQIRHVELNRRAKAGIERQKALTYLAYQDVFLHPATGQPYNDDKPPRLYWNQTLKALGIRHRVAYQTRHTYATLNLMAGANPMWVARQLGHRTMKMLLERYSRWIDQADQRSEASKLDRVMGQNRGQKEGATG